MMTTAVVEKPARPALEPWLCDGTRREKRADGTFRDRPCNQPLLEAYLAPGSRIKKVCEKCGTVNTWRER